MGIAGIAVLGMICVQLDKMLLSRILSLDMFGYYTLAAGSVGVFKRTLAGFKSRCRIPR